MTYTKIYLWRHGRTSYNLQRRIQGQIDIPLDAVGVWQARVAAGALAQMLSLDPVPPLLVSSDLVRASQTAQELAAKMKLQLHLDPALREKAFGPWEGLNRTEILQQWPFQGQQWLDGHEPTGIDLEASAQVAARLKESLKRWVAAAVPGQSVVFASHGSVIRTAVSELVGTEKLSRDALRVPENAHWAVLEDASLTSGEQSRWRLVTYNQGPLVPIQRWRGQSEPK